MTNEKIKAMDGIEGDWKEISKVEDVKKFQNILGVLNRYYTQFSEKSSTQIFRELIASSSPEAVKLSLKKFGEYEYLIKAEVGDKSESWIHIDGIAEERKTHASNNNLYHPVFEITCLTDIFNS